MRISKQCVPLCGLCFSGILIILLILGIPTAVIRDNESFKEDLFRTLDREEDVVALKQRSRLELSHLLSSNRICKYLLSASLIGFIINEGILVLDLVANRNRSAKAAKRDVQP